MALQETATRYPRSKFLGMLDYAFALEHQIFKQVAGVALKPGDAVVWNRTTKKWVLPTDADDEVAVGGIVTYEVGDDTNADQEIEYAADDLIRVVRFGGIVVQAGEAITQHDMLSFDRSARKFVRRTEATATNARHVQPIEAVEDAVLDGLLTVLCWGPTR